MRSIGARAFEDAAEMTEVVFPSSVVYVARSAFLGCSAIRRVTLPAGFDGDTPRKGFFFARSNSTLSSADDVLRAENCTNVQTATYLKTDYSQSGALPAGSSYGYVTYCFFESGVPVSFKVLFPDYFTLKVDDLTLMNDVNTPSSKEVTFTPDESRAYRLFLRGTVGAGLDEGAWDATCRSDVQIRIGSADWQPFDAASSTPVFCLDSESFLPAATLQDIFPASYNQLEGVDASPFASDLADGFFDGCDALVDANVILPPNLVLFGRDNLWPSAQTEARDGFVFFRKWLIGCEDESATTLTLPTNSPYVGTRAFASMLQLRNVCIPDGISVIGKEAFSGDVGLKRIQLPSSVRTVADAAFLNCTAVEEIALTNGLVTIGASAFENCALVQTLDVSQTVRTIGSRAFADNWRLLSVNLPLGVTNCSESAFSGCSGVTGVTFPTHLCTLTALLPSSWANVTDVCVVHDETSVIEDCFSGCTKLASVVLPDSITNIAARAFFGCSALASLTLPTSLRAIGDSAFENCTALTLLRLPVGLSSIGERACAGCPLESLVLPTLLVALGGQAFPSTLSAAYFMGNAPTGAADPFSRSDAIAYVASGTTDWDGVKGSTTLPQRWHGHEIRFWTTHLFDATFDAGDGVFKVGDASARTYAVEQITGQRYVLPPTQPVRAGFTFEGWWTQQTGGAQVTSETVVTAISPVTLYAHWANADRLIRVDFNPCGGVVTEASCTYAADMPYGELPVPTREGYAFVCWATAATGGLTVDETTLAPSTDATLYAQWTPIAYVLRFDANGGTGSMADQSVAYDDATAINACAFTCEGHAFAGWALSPDGDIAFSDGDAVLNLRTAEGSVVVLYAVWSEIVQTYAIRFEANGGSGSMSDCNLRVGEVATLPKCAFLRDGFVFAGWALSVDGEVVYGDEAAVSDLAAAREVATLYAQWRTPPPVVRSSLFASGDATPFTGGTTSTGWIRDTNSNLVALVTLKAARANRKTGLSKLTATITPLDGSRKYTLTGTASVGEVVQTTLSDRAGHSLDITLAGQSASSTSDDSVLDTSSLPFGGTAGTYAVTLADAEAIFPVSLVVTARGKVKGTVVTSSGGKVAFTSQAVTGDGVWCVPIAVNKKDLALSCLVWFKGGEIAKIDSTPLAPISEYCGTVCTPQTDIKLFSVPNLQHDMPDALAEFLPSNVAVRVGRRWSTVEKAGKAKYDRNVGQFVGTTANPTGLKLKYAPSTGLFAGSFKVYVPSSPTSLKSMTFTLTGLYVNDHGVGTAYCRKLGKTTTVLVE